MTIQSWFPLGLTGWICLQSKGFWKVFSSTTVWRHQFFSTQPCFIVQLSYPYMTTGKTIALTRWTFVDKGMSLLFNMLSRLVIAFLPRSKHLLISWLQAPVTICGAFGVLSQLFHSPLSLSSRVSLVLLCFLPWGWYYLHIWGCWYFSWQSWFQLVPHPALYFMHIS